MQVQDGHTECARAESETSLLVKGRLRSQCEFATYPKTCCCSLDCHLPCLDNSEREQACCDTLQSSRGKQVNRPGEARLSRKCSLTDQAGRQAAKLEQRSSVFLHVVARFRLNWRNRRTYRKQPSSNNYKLGLVQPVSFGKCVRQSCTV